MTRIIKHNNEMTELRSIAALAIGIIIGILVTLLIVFLFYIVLINNLDINIGKIVFDINETRLAESAYAIASQGG